MKKLILVVTALFMAVAVYSAESETVKGAKKDVVTFKKDMSVKLDKLETQIAELRKQAQASGDQAKTKAADELATTRDQMKTKIADLSDDTNKGWQNMKKNLANSVESLNKKVQKALKE